MEGGFELVNGLCGCPSGHIHNGSSCELGEGVGCPEGTYFSGDTWCYYCEDSCSFCADITGECLYCGHQSYVINDYVCECPAGSLDTGSYCFEPVECTESEFRTKGNTCESCADENCEQCADETGECWACKAGFIAMNGECTEMDGDCAYPYGPSNSFAGCLPSKAEKNRLLPKYDDNAVNVDWREWGVVNPARAQGGCGSCWSFGVIATVETWHAITFGPLFELSEQHLVDCDSSNNGCSGGWPTDAF